MTRCVFSNASGIMVLATMVRIAPSANAVITASTLSASLDGAPARTLFADARHGDVRGWYDPADGSLNRSAVYDPAGEVVASSADRLPLGFQGGYSDPQTGMLNAHARWHEPSSASFASRDTYTLSPDPVAQANRYAYGNGSPLNNVDTDGHVAWAVGGLALFEVSNPVGWGIFAVTVVGGAYVGYKGYQSYQYHQQVTNSASTWGGVASQPVAAAPAVNYVYGQNMQSASLAQAWAAYEQAASRARINAKVTEMTGRVQPVAEPIPGEQAGRAGP
jgi:RHS repeat-associated protein